MTEHGMKMFRGVELLKTPHADLLLLPIIVGTVRLSRPFNWSMPSIRKKAFDLLSVEQTRWRVFGVYADKGIVAEMENKCRPAEKLFQDGKSLEMSSLSRTQLTSAAKKLMMEALSFTLIFYASTRARRK